MLKLKFKNVQLKFARDIKKQKCLLVEQTEQDISLKDSKNSKDNKENEQLTDSELEDIVWNDEEFEDKLNKLSPTAFETILTAAKKPGPRTSHI
ncbi:unnamed protein product [Rhizophagus irregularis]|nr:unnamed protein product [Rhizophagus irregularis]